LIGQPGFSDGSTLGDLHFQERRDMAVHPLLPGLEVVVGQDFLDLLGMDFRRKRAQGEEAHGEQDNSEQHDE
jgi:hypothetical protein